MWNRVVAGLAKHRAIATNSLVFGSLSGLADDLCHQLTRRARILPDRLPGVLARQHLRRIERFLLNLRRSMEVVVARFPRAGEPDRGEVIGQARPEVIALLRRDRGRHGAVLAR